MKRASFLTGAAGAIWACGASAVFADGAKPGPYCVPLPKGVADLVYDFELYLLDGNGKTFRLGDALGSPVWLNFYATWCPPCNEEAGVVLDLADKYIPQGLRVVGVDVGEDAAKARDFRDHFKINYPIVLDDKSSVFKGLGLSSYPTHMFLHRNGKISCVVIGEFDDRAMENEIDVVMQQAPSGRSLP